MDADQWHKRSPDCRERFGWWAQEVLGGAGDAVYELCTWYDQIDPVHRRVWRNVAGDARKAGPGEGPCWLIDLWIRYPLLWSVQRLKT